MSIDRYRAQGGIHQVPLPSTVPGELWVAGFSVVGPNPASVLDEIGATTLVCLLEKVEIDRRYPEFAEWLSEPGRHRARWFPIEDFEVAEDEATADLVGALVDDLCDGERIVLHCGAGIGRTGLIASLVLCQLGMEPDEALAVVRAARPGAGPQSPAQDAQLHRLNTP